VECPRKRVSHPIFVSEANLSSENRGEITIQPHNP